MARYAELEITTNFSFLRGGSHPEELVATAKAFGLEAIAVTDHNTLAGVVRAHLAAREVGGIKFIVGARLDLQDAPSLLAYPRDRAAYGRLCRLLTLGQRRAEKGQCTLFLDDVPAHAEDLIFIALPPDDFAAASALSSLDGRSRAKTIALPPHPSRHATCAELRSRKIAAESPLPQGARGFDEAARFFPSPLAGEGGSPLQRRAG
jgi:PHP domain